MKKSQISKTVKFAILINFLMIFFSNAQIVNIPDAHFKNSLIELGVDTNNDSEIQETEAQSFIGDMDLNGKQITDLTGIKSFSNIKNLYAGDNNLTHIDLSNMVKLEKVYCGKNTIISINLNGMAKLNYLHCESNLLTTINLQGLLYLKYLNLDKNQFTSLLINNLPSLEISSIEGNNQPLTLSFSNLPILKTIYAQGSQLTSINVSGLQALKILECGNNQLNSISFKDNVLQNLSYLNVTYNPLQFICKDNFDQLPNTGNIPQLINNCELSTQQIVKDKLKIIISPNPVKEFLNLNLQVKEIKIFNLEGRIVFNRDANKDLKINISNLPAGLYLLHTELGNAKFIKE